MSGREIDSAESVLVNAFKKFFPDIKFVTLESLDNDEPPDGKEEDEEDDELGVEE